MKYWFKHAYFLLILSSIVACGGSSEQPSSPSIAPHPVQNAPPMADAGGDQAINTGSSVSLSANASHDSDGMVASAAVSVNVIVTTPNSAPLADAGVDQNMNTGALVTLNRTASSDVNGDSLSYQWVLTTPTGSNTRLNNSALPSPTFTADVAGTFTASYQLTSN